ncbi:hypothetical protein B0H12DRAFT_1110228 [Mycena haematopus]|nr:hypothetical protein B0H12DRAFT_1110228 [Mycena haematopus]
MCLHLSASATSLGVPHPVSCEMLGTWRESSSGSSIVQTSSHRSFGHPTFSTSPPDSRRMLSITVTHWVRHVWC